MTRPNLLRTGLLLGAFLMPVTASGGGGKGGGKGGGGGDPPTDYGMVYIDLGGAYVGNMIKSAVDGTGAKAISKNIYASDLVLSPDGTQVAFRATLSNVSGIYTCGLDGSNVQLVTLTENSQPQGLDWCPGTHAGRSWLAFADPDPADPGGFLQLQMVATDGTGRCNLTGSSQIYDEDASFDPSGTRVLTRRWDARFSSYVLFVILDLDFSSGVPAVVGETMLNPPGSPLGAGYSYDGPAFSKAGDLVAVSWKPDGVVNMDLWLIDLQDPWHPYQLTATPDNNEGDPEFTADDGEVYFWAWNALGTNSIHAVGLDGTGYREVTPAGPRDRFVWPYLRRF